MKKKVKFALISDIHYGLDHSFLKGKTLGSSASAILMKFISKMNNCFKPDFVMSLGDMFSDQNHDNDKRFLDTLHSQLSKLHAPTYFVIGNHDLKNLKDKELKQMLDMKRFSYSFDYCGIRFIVLYSFAKINRTSKMYDVLIRKRQLVWLSNLLAKTKTPVIIFNHYPLDEQDLQKNPYAGFFLKYKNRAAVINRKEVRSIIERSGKVLAVFSGHLHWKNKTIIKGIPYYSIPSLTEIKQGAWAEVVVQGHRVSVHLKNMGI